jgi:D-glycero-D-manno-heptose 1,7-bisphosphate phosphatase
MHKAIFLDRDGVINRKAKTDDEYVICWEKMKILSGVPEAITLLNRSGFQVIVVTNQRAVAKGLISIADLEAMHRRMCEYLARKGASVDAVYYCPHELQPQCECRKPSPGMLFEAARTHNIDLTASWMIGDSEKDVQAGVRAGCRTARVVRENRLIESNADIVAKSLLSAIQKILDVRSQHSTNEHRRDGSTVMRSLNRS